MSLKIRLESMDIRQCILGRVGRRRGLTSTSMGFGVGFLNEDTQYGLRQPSAQVLGLSSSQPNPQLD